MTPASGARRPGRLLALFPLTYALHVVEEAMAGETFPVWFSRVAGATLSRGDFFVINAVGMLLIATAAFVAARNPGRTPLQPMLGTLVLVNGTLHAGATLLTGGYSPGAVTGLFLWIPLGAWALRDARSTLPPRLLLTGITLGVGLQALVTWVATTI